MLKELPSSISTAFKHHIKGSWIITYTCSKFVARLNILLLRSVTQGTNVKEHLVCICVTPAALTKCQYLTPWEWRQTSMYTDTAQVIAVSSACLRIPLSEPKWLNKYPLCAQQPWLGWVSCTSLKKKYRKVPLVVPEFTCPVQTPFPSKLF